MSRSRTPAMKTSSEYVDALLEAMARLSPRVSLSDRRPFVRCSTGRHLVNSRCRAGGSNRSRLEPKWLSLSLSLFFLFFLKRSHVEVVGFCFLPVFLPVFSPVSVLPAFAFLVSFVLLLFACCLFTFYVSYVFLGFSALLSFSSFLAFSFAFLSFVSFAFGVPPSSAFRLLLPLLPWTFG